MSDASDTSANAAAAAWDPAADLAAPIEVTSGESAASIVYLCRFPGCGRQFPLKGNLKRHQNIHSGDKQFRCPHCDRSFLRKADMEVHLRVHTGEKPYACKHAGCDKRFARRSDLLSHERTHSGSKPFACEFPGCDRRFARRFDLHKHERSHDEEAGGAARATGAAKKPTMKRRLVATPRATRLVVTGHEDCEQCQMEMDQEREDDDVTTQDGDEESSTAATDDAAEPTKPRRAAATTMVASTAAAMRVAPISPTDHVHGPGKEFHFELTCTEDHIHTSPECFSMEELDALLGPSSAPVAGCCPEHLQSIAEAFATAHAHAHVHDSFHQSMGIVASYPHPHAGGRIPCYSSGGREPHGDMPPSVSSFGPFPTHLAPTPLPPPSPPTTPARSPTDAMTAQLSSTSLNSPCPVVATAKLDDYAAHTACGHLAIQHGDHRDFVVKNHLVCVDSVKSISGDCGGAHAGAKPHRALPRPAATKCAPQDPHRPGCGHLAVRHGDHIDYVVEDNLFCQLAGGLMEDAGNLELLDDDFWEFYGAIGSLKTE